ncbi:hypothetical protein [Nostoc sp. LPT]|uniref:hypothetical protein n=1 Tax=Nostoc sp. LPT TaxID=2815387 RepID=UPI001DDC05F3|nr:hypothetical protein [Nostoc sp. LPT]MBN4004936.1 hypothetical protein [Nostoc sp. LPT]
MLGAIWAIFYFIFYFRYTQNIQASVEMKAIIFCTTMQVGISAIIGLLWAIIYLLYSQNIQINLKLLLYSFLGGLLGGIVGGFIGHLIGLRAYKEATGGLFIGGEGKA